MDDTGFDTLARSLAALHSRRALTRLVSGAALGGSLALGGLAQVGARKKRKKKPKCRPARDDAVVAYYCVRSGGAGTTNYEEIGQSFSARQGGRLDRVDLNARGGPGGRFAVEIRDLNQGKGVSTAPVIGSAEITVPAIAQGAGQRVTARFATDAGLVADDQYALVVRFLGAGDNQQNFRTANADACFGAGALLGKRSGETAFTPSDDVKLEHTVYVVP